MLHFSPLMAYIIYGNFIAPFLQGGNSTQCALIAFAQFSYFLLYTSFYSFCYTQHTKGFRFHYQQHIKSFFESIRRRSNNEKKKTATTKTEVAKDRITCWRKAHSRVGVVVVAVSTFHKKIWLKGEGVQVARHLSAGYERDLRLYFCILRFLTRYKEKKMQ